MADLARQQQQHAQEIAASQRQMDQLKSRAAATTDPSFAAQQSRRSSFARAGAIAGAGQLVSAYGPSIAKNLPGVHELGSLAGFAAGPTNANIGGQMANTAAGAASNVAGGALTGAAIGSLGGPLGAGVGAAIGAMAAGSKEIAMLPLRVKDFAESLVESQRGLSRYSGPLSQAFAQSDVRGLRRDIASAHATGDTTAKLVGSLDDLQDVLRPLKDSVTSGLGTTLQAGVNLLTVLVPEIVKLKIVLEGMGNNLPFGAGQAFRGAMIGLDAAADVVVNQQNQQPPPNVKALEQAIEEFRGRDRSIPRQVPRR
jgi:hypothetical protein